MDKEQPSDKRKVSNRSPPYALFNLLVIVVAIMYGAYYKMYLEKDPAQSEVADVPESDDLQKIPLFTADDLKKFDGVSEYCIVCESRKEIKKHYIA